jgi:cation:H+ antiporter
VIWDILMLFGSFLLIMASCEFFTNGIEWFGKKLRVGEGVVGSIFAAVGTALPESSVSIAAIVKGTESGHKIGMGAILGAPFMLSTLAFFVCGLSATVLHLMKRRKMEMLVDHRVVGKDIRYFVLIYLFAALSPTFEHFSVIRHLVAIALVLLYLDYMRRMFSESGGMMGELHPLHLDRARNEPRMWRVVVQVLVSLCGIAIGARYFVNSVEDISMLMGVSPMILSIIIAPIATELPEKMNSIIWIARGKDTLALGNITGAMTFQGSLLVAIGIWFTSWDIGMTGMVTISIALLSSSLVLISIRRRGYLSPWALLMGGGFYLLFVLYLVASGVI